MSVLSGPEIVFLVERTRRMTAEGLTPLLPSIEIEPFDPTLAGPNSYDVHLGPRLRVYSDPNVPDGILDLSDRWVTVLDPRRDNPTRDFPIPDYGFVLQPGELYLGSTVERTRCDGLVPWLDGRSSVGRLGISLHVTAGRGDDGWGGHWTLEITAVKPVRVYPGMRIGQITFMTLEGKRKPYQGRYQGQVGPTASRIHLPTPEAE